MIPGRRFRSAYWHPGGITGARVPGVPGSTTDIDGADGVSDGAEDNFRLFMPGRSDNTAGDSTPGTPGGDAGGTSAGATTASIIAVQMMEHTRQQHRQQQAEQQAHTNNALLSHPSLPPGEEAWTLLWIWPPARGQLQDGAEFARKASRWCEQPVTGGTINVLAVLASHIPGMFREQLSVLRLVRWTVRKSTARQGQRTYD
eukprot:7061062-Pyramimonas_sp.AAC.3